MIHMLASRITTRSGESSYDLEDKMEDVDSQDSMYWKQFVEYLQHEQITCGFP